MPIYFFSRALQDSEINYSSMEKLVLALVHASRRLRRYFQAYPIAVITDQPIKQILSHPEIAKRILKWRPDEDGPLVEIQVKEAVPDLWTLFTDGSSCLEGSGAGLILTNPKGVDFTYALRFEFKASNNKVEYEALVAGLGIAEQMGVQNFTHLTKQVLVEVLKEKSIEEKEILAVVEEEGYCWMTPLLEYLTDGTLPVETKKARTIKIKSRQHALINGVLYLCRFGLLGEIVSDNGKQFRDNPLKDWCEKLNIIQRFASVKHPQTNRQVERANPSLREGIKARLGEENKNWVEEVPYVLWAHRTTIKTSNGHTPFSLTYGTEAVIPVETGMPSLSNEASHTKDNGKFGPKWEGPYEVVETLEKEAYKIRNSSGDILPRTWNVKDLKKCYL
ncbi:reverse transcriptase domain-containing protein [Tanacetum coccineum]